MIANLLLQTKIINLEGRFIRLLEYESKEVFNQFDIPLAKYFVIERGENIEEKVKEFTFPAIMYLI